MTERNALVGILSDAVIKGHNLTTRVGIEKLADHLLSQGVVVRPKTEKMSGSKTIQIKKWEYKENGN